MTKVKGISYPALTSFLHEEIDRRYKNKNSGPWRTQENIADKYIGQAEQDHWFTLNRVLNSAEGKRILQDFCRLKNPRIGARSIEDFLVHEFQSSGLVSSGIQSSWRYNCEHLAYLIWLFSNTNQKNKAGRPPDRIKEIVASVKAIKNERDFSFPTKLRKLQAKLNNRDDGAKNPRTGKYDWDLLSDTEDEDKERVLRIFLSNAGKNSV